MNAKTLIAATAFAASACAFAGEAAAPAAAPAAVPAAAPAAVTVVASTAVARLNAPSLPAASARTRAEVKAEAVEAARTHKTTLALQLEQYQ